jgi:hypothetical protein
MLLLKHKTMKLFYIIVKKCKNHKLSCNLNQLKTNSLLHSKQFYIPEFKITVPKELVNGEL